MSGRPSLVGSLLTGDREGVGGVLCNDPTGLCLVARGVLDSDSGAYTNITRLAAQLRPKDGSVAPLVTIESDTAAILVKEYDGHAVAVRVPMKAPTESVSASAD